jgi:NTP pyrophosphatase (non-canonical NTP hydrolase)
MDINEYQRLALETDKTAANYENEPQKDVVVALLGIAGELGTLAATYKKYLRDGKSYQLHKPDLAVEIGDLLWYAAVLANKGLSNELCN